VHLSSWPITKLSTNQWRVYIDQAGGEQGRVVCGPQYNEKIGVANSSVLYTGIGALHNSFGVLSLYSEFAAFGA